MVSEALDCPDWPETLVLYRMRPTVSVQVGSVLRARPIQRFEGSRPWGGVMQIQWLGLRESKVREQLLELEAAKAGLLWLKLLVQPPQRNGVLSGAEQLNSHGGGLVSGIWFRGQLT